ncbi:MAG: hypothetical protein B6242_06715 [Anaerolineaceae bacterium 4572_78]|nr:MAG: hypothetical protein B6242_06715 [Anaerolineaceae bacterium 4572_78]
MTVLERTRESIISLPQLPTMSRYLPPTSVWQNPDDETGKRVTLEEYWEHYYENGDYNYEYVDGCLEAKPMAKYIDVKMYSWVTGGLSQYLRVNPIAKFTTLEMGFKFRFISKTQVRKPDIGIVLNSNPIPL